MLLNWAYYGYDDWRAAQHTLVANASLGDWMQAYATTIDELAWFALLFLFEAETYWLEEEQITRLKRTVFVAIRICCYGFLAHTVYAYIWNFRELAMAAPLAATDLCALADQGTSFMRNLAYSDITSSSCSSIISSGQLFLLDGQQVVTDAAGLSEAKWLAAIDIQDAIVWLLVVVIIEAVVVLQERGVSEGPAIKTANAATVLLYTVLVGHAVYWAWKGHWVYAWDELLWIGGFAAIEMNLSEWRDELVDEAAAA